MLAISLTFPAKRFHATPWGRQVNEGAVEWPPSPWRLLRSLVATWHHKFPNVPEAAIRELVEKLAPAPRFSLPAASQGHTRHYMPLVNDERTKVFDTFIAVEPDDRVIAVWSEVSLTDEQMQLLDNLLRAMTYFGRAESWVCGQVLDESPESADVAPIELGEPVEEERELVRTLVPVLAEDHLSWFVHTREEHRTRRLSELKQLAQAKGKSTENVKLSKKDEQVIDSSLPATLFDALHANTAELRRGGWNQPPGTRWINYSRSANAFATQYHSRLKSHRSSDKPTVARLAVCGRVRPMFVDQLWFAEQLRKTLMRCSKQVDLQIREKNGLNSESANAAQVFSGKDIDGNPLRIEGRDHGHAHILCEVSKDDHRITHVTIFAPMGFQAEDEQAIARLVNPRYPLRWNGYEVQLVLLGIGTPAEFGGKDEKAGQSRLLDKSCVWTSRTPFVLTRHLARKGHPSAEMIAADPKLKNALIEVVRFELAKRPEFQSLANDVEIEALLETKQLGTDLNGRFTTWMKFRRERLNGGGSKAGLNGFGFRLTFPEPVSGPIALGYGCHFGLGVFRSERTNE